MTESGVMRAACFFGLCAGPVDTRVTASWVVGAGESRRALIKSSQQYAVMALFDASNLIGSEASGSLVVLAFKPLSR